MIAVPAASRLGTSAAAAPCGRARKTASTGGSSASIVRLGRGEVRVDPADRVVVAAAADEPDELDVRVSRQQPDQLGADIAGRPDDPDPDPARPARRVDAPLRTGELRRSRRSLPSARRRRVWVSVSKVVIVA